MADELQALLDRIDRDGIRKGEEEAAKIIAQAKSEAEKVVSDAQAEASKLLATTREECETMRQKSEEALRQSGRQILLEVRGALSERVSGAIRNLLKASLDTTAVAGIIADLCRGFVKADGNESDIKVLVSASQLETLETAVKAQLAADLREHVTLAPSRGLASGFKLVFTDSDVVYDFSDEALIEAISAHLSPALTAIIAEK
jgi:V/A-type H+/Na+-transporting ATPase subunit E